MAVKQLFLVQNEQFMNLKTAVNVRLYKEV